MHPSFMQAYIHTSKHIPHLPQKINIFGKDSEKLLWFKVWCLPQLLSQAQISLHPQRITSFQLIPRGSMLQERPVVESICKAKPSLSIQPLKRKPDTRQVSFQGKQVLQQASSWVSFGLGLQ